MTTHSRLGTRVVRLGLCLGIAGAALLAPAARAAEATQTPKAAPVTQRTFGTPEEAAEALILAAERFDIAALMEIVGPDGDDLVVTGDPVQDRNNSIAFAAQAHKQTRVVRDPAHPKTAILYVGTGEWPAPMPIVQKRGKWRIDSMAGRREILYRRIGTNELDAINVCRGYVEAQQEYALGKHDGARVNQYAQRMISTPGRQDGLAWRAADGTWQGPVGETIAQVISEGYTERYDPFHGYYFRILKGQGPDAPFGAMDFVVEGAMIGGFALVAAPAEYEVTGVKSFIVSHEGIVYEQDLGPTTLDQFRAMKLFNPDPTWTPVAIP